MPSSRRNSRRPIDALLAKLIRVEDELIRLDEEKKRLRQELMSAMETMGLKARQLGGATAVLRSRIAVDYDDALLRERLGMKYAWIVEPVARQVKSVLLADPERYAELLCKTGKPSRKQVQLAIENAKVDPGAFQGAFTKTSITSMALRRHAGAPA